MTSMGFPESVKTQAKRRSHFACVWCQHTEQFIEVHHIIPQEENGPDTLDNAAPLCPNCHTIIGNNSDVRKQLRERRDWWWTYCDTRNAILPTEDTAQRLDELVSSLKTIEEQGGRNEAVLTEIKSQVLGQLTAQATAVSSASTTHQIIMATGRIDPTGLQVTATVTFSGSRLRDGMPDPYNSYFVASSAEGITGPTGDTRLGAVVSVIPVAGDSAGPGRHLFLPGRSPEDGLEIALRTLRELPQNQGLKEEFYRRTESAV